LRLASTGAVRKFLAENPSEFDPRKFLKVTTSAMQALCQNRYESFGAAGNASKFRAIGLEAMADMYGV
jgi:fructose-bisphosphate aldolase class II